MGFVLLLIFVLLLLNTFLKAVKTQQTSFVIEPIAKNCPPHKWRYQDIRDTEGNLVKWTMVCDICGPLKPSKGPARME
jgi:hypothetical protein